MELLDIYDINKNKDRKILKNKRARHKYLALIST